MCAKQIPRLASASLILSKTVKCWPWCQLANFLKPGGPRSMHGPMGKSYLQSNLHHLSHEVVQIIKALSLSSGHQISPSPIYVISWCSRSESVRYRYPTWQRHISTEIQQTCVSHEEISPALWSSAATLDGSQNRELMCTCAWSGDYISGCSANHCEYMHCSPRAAHTQELTHQAFYGSGCSVCLCVLAALAKTFRNCYLGIIAPSDHVLFFC